MARVEGSGATYCREVAAYVQTCTDFPRRMLACLLAGVDAIRALYTGVALHVRSWTHLSGENDVKDADWHLANAAARVMAAADLGYGRIDVNRALQQAQLREVQRAVELRLREVPKEGVYIFDDVCGKKYPFTPVIALEESDKVEKTDILTSRTFEGGGLEKTVPITYLEGLSEAQTRDEQLGCLATILSHRAFLMGSQMSRKIKGNYDGHDISIPSTVIKRGMEITEAHPLYQLLKENIQEEGDAMRYIIRQIIDEAKESIVIGLKKKLKLDLDRTNGISNSITVGEDSYDAKRGDTTLQIDEIWYKIYHGVAARMPDACLLDIFREAALIFDHTGQTGNSVSYNPLVLGVLPLHLLAVDIPGEDSGLSAFLGREGDSARFTVSSFRNSIELSKDMRTLEVTSRYTLEVRSEGELALPAFTARAAARIDLTTKTGEFTWALTPE